ncbi:MAG: aminotransferase class V-fold PLP-dependent enzyme [Peptostreptococcaceae bacterium]|nr:aminotransferase class V-fold PLP-dependent enzyme [Peptostreptococcaceae bacterium]
MIYLDNAATTLHKPQIVVDAVAEAMQSLGNCGRGAGEQALDAARTIYDTREKTARFFGCTRPDHVVFTPNATVALNIAIGGLFGAGDHVVTTDLEHNSVLRPLYRVREQGGEVTYLPVNDQGDINFEDLERVLQPNTKGIVCLHGSNVVGNVIDIARIGEFTRKHGLYLVVDVSQTAGVFPIDMEKMQIDVLCFTGHKSLYGPQGTGGLCVRAGVEIKPLYVGGTGVHSFDEHQPEDYPTRLEAGTLNGHGLAGLNAAFDFLNQTGLDVIRKKEQKEMQRFLLGIKELSNVTVYGNYIDPRTALVTLNIGEMDAATVSDELAYRYGIATRAGAHCAPRIHRAMGTVEQGAVRFSWSYFNTKQDTEVAIAAIKEIAREA